MKRFKHNLSHYKLLSCNMGNLVPVGLTEVLPGDTIQQATSLLLRCSPLLAPVMHPVHVRVHHWFVPHRLVWDDWEKFITGGPDGMNASVLPQIDFTGSPVAEGSLADYLGVPTGYNLPLSALPFRGYSLIWNEWYRDQDLQTELTVAKTSGTDTTTNRTLQKVAWEKDYFTTARPWPQKGGDVTIPSEGSVDVTVKTNAAQIVRLAATGAGAGTVGALSSNSSSNLLAGTGAYIDPNGTLEVDLDNFNEATIRDLREAFALERYREARARYGSRYTEYLRYLGVQSSDARLQRPEYLGGGKQTIQFSEVLQTGVSVDSADEPIGEVGALKGHGIAAMRSNRYRRFFEEHGYVFSFVSVRPKTMYIQGLQKHWSYATKEDFFQKELQFVGQQSIDNREIYWASFPGNTFGWQDRYDQYRRGISTVSGEFRSTLDFWHMARKFSSAPALNASFVAADPTDRIFAVPSEDTLWIMANHSIQARRMVAPSGGNSFVY